MKEKIERLNIFCQDAKYRLEIHNHDPQQILAGCLMIKLLNDTQGAYSSSSTA